MIKLSAVIITKNEERNIPGCLEALKEVADEIVVIDSGSADRTRELGEAAGCRVIPHDFEGYGQQKQFGVDSASHDWILSIDADERLTPGLIAEIRSLKEAGFTKAAYNLPFRLVYLGRIMKHSGTGNEKHIRLFDRRQGRFTQVSVHEGIEVIGSIGELKGTVLHYSYRDLFHHLEKINTYTSQAAEGYAAKGKRFPKCWPALKFPVSFFTFYILKGGILDGYPGFMWSFLAAFYGSLKIAKTLELTKKQ
jgi:glycosyltransferase involved in cell wall biosynthesis